MGYQHTLRLNRTVNVSGSSTQNSVPHTHYMVTGNNWHTYRTLNLADPSTCIGALVAVGFQDPRPEPSYSWRVTGHINGVANNPNFSSTVEVERGMFYCTGQTWISI